MNKIFFVMLQAVKVQKKVRPKSMGQTVTKEKGMKWPGQTETNLSIRVTDEAFPVLTTVVERRTNFWRADFLHGKWIFKV